MAPKPGPGQITIADYLLTRLAQLGVKKIFGVPGDFTLGFLDYVEDHKDVEWVGTCNELNAAYAADGYSRVKHGLSAVCTTFGVGELSALNGVAGGFSEHIPIVHIVGVPATILQAHHALLHHTLGDGRFDAFAKCSENVTIDQAYLKSTNTAGEQIDRLLKVALVKMRPVYLTLPTDLVYATIDAAPLYKSLTKEDIFKVHQEETKSEVETAIIQQICNLYEQSKKPIILIDACAIRFGVQPLVEELVDKTGMTFYTSPMGKTALSEDHPQFGGVYVGELSHEEVRDGVNNADLYFMVGALLSDFNTGNFSYRIQPEQKIELHSDHTKVQYAHFPESNFFTLLPKLAEALGKISKEKPKEVIKKPENAGLVKKVPDENADPSGKIVQEHFWPLISGFLRKGDVVVAETGTSAFGMIDVHFPKEATFVSQVLWGSIGWATGSALGAASAAAEFNPPRRAILFIGDGSFQVTVQDVSTMIRQGLKPIIVVLNNDGYTIERLIHGPERVYNDIQPWNWQEMLSFFGAKNYKSWRAATLKEFNDILANQEFAAADKVQVLEVIMDRLDAPRALIAQAVGLSKSNAY